MMPCKPKEKTPCFIWVIRGHLGHQRKHGDNRMEKKRKVMIKKL